MESNSSIENAYAGEQDPAKELSPEITIQERLLALELQLKIFKQAESIGEIGNWQINLNTFETLYSDNVFRIYGLEPHTVNAHPDTFDGFLHEDDRKVVLTAFEKSYLEKVPLHLEFRIRRLDGQERYIKIVSCVTKNPNGEPLLTGITQDITDRKILEIQIREYAEKMQLQNESYRQAEQIGMFGSFQVNLTTRQTQFSENFFRIFGLKPTSLAPGLEEFYQFIHPDDHPQLRELVKKMYEEQLPPETDFRIMRSDGRPRFARMKGKLLKNADGDMIVAGVIKDITSFTKLESQLKETNEQLLIQNETFRQAEKAANIGSWTWKLKSDEFHFSDQVFAIFGLRTISDRTSCDSLESFIHPMDKPGVKEVAEEIRKRPAEVEFRYRIMRPDGKIRFIRTNCFPIISPAGEEMILGITQDVTEEFLLSQQLKERSQFAETLNENVSEKVCLTNSSNIIIGWNTQAENSFHLKKAEVLGRNLFEVLPKLKNAELVGMFNKALNGESIHLCHTKIPYIENFQELSLVPFREGEGEGEVTSVLMLLNNISEHPKLKAELEK